MKSDCFKGKGRITEFKGKGNLKTFKSKAITPFTLKKVIVEEVTWLYDGGFANSVYLDNQIKVLDDKGNILINFHKSETKDFTLGDASLEIQITSPKENGIKKRFTVVRDTVTISKSKINWEEK